MADVAGFRALGYAETGAAHKYVAPAELESATERERCAALDPHNVVRLLDPRSSSGATDLAAAWLASGVLRQDAGRCMYRYHQEYTPELGGRTLVRKGLLCAVRLPSLADGGVKRHLAVREDEVAAQAATMLRHHLHAAPAMAAFRDPAFEVDRLFRKLEGTAPMAQVQTADGVWHRIWRCNDAEVIGKVRHLFLPRKLYLLDGHERLAAMQAAGAQLAEQSVVPMYAAANYATMCLVNLEDQSLLPAPCHRLVGGPALPAAEVLARAARYFSIVKLDGLATSPDRLARAIEEWTTPSCFGLMFAGQPEVWQLSMLPAVNPREEGVEVHPALARLDAVVIEEMFLARVLGKPPTPVATPAVAAAAIAAATPASAATLGVPAAGAALAGAERWPVAIAHNAARVMAALSGASAWLGVLARALPMQHVVHVADLGQALPPRSTHFFPPLLGGLAMLHLTVDEDLV
jgi:uncharacterized protein (DUF1015 family)